MNSKPRYSTPMKRLLFITIPLLLTLSCIESIARLFPLPNVEPPSVGMQLQAHPTRIWSMTPGSQKQFGATVTIDERGMRATNTTAHSQKWIVLGDSSFFGHGLNGDETLHHHLETSLRNSGENIDVLCGATPGYSTLQSLDFMNDIGWELNPSVLVIGNLWSDNNFDHFTDAEWMAELNSPRNRLLHHLKRSHLFLHLTRALRPNLINESTPKASPHAKISWVRDPYANGHRRVPLPLYWKTLSHIIAQAESRNVAVLLIQPANKHRLDIVDVEVTWDPYFKAQEQVAEHFQVPILDVAPTLRAFGLSKQGAFLDDMHPTSEANFWIAQAILNQWSQSNTGASWIPSTSTLPSIDIPDRWSTMAERD